MAHRSVLSAAQRTSFDRLPKEPEELIQHYTLNNEDLMMVYKRRGSANRLGFAVQLCLARYPGRVLRINEVLPFQLVAFIAEQTKTKVNDFSEYAKRDQTRRGHIALLIAELGFIQFTQSYFRNMVRWLVPIAVENPKSVFLVGAVFNELRHKHVFHPHLSVIERLVASVKVKANQRIFSLINSRLTDNNRTTLDAWLALPNIQTHTLFSIIRQPVGRPCPANVMAILERLDAIHDLNLPSSLLDEFPAARRESLAREGNRVTTQNLRTFGDDRRYTVMAVSIIDIHKSLVDEAINMHDRIVSALIRKSKRKHADQMQGESKRIKKAISTFSTLSKALMDAKQTGQDAWESIDNVLSWDELCKTAKDIEELSSPRKLNHLHFVDAQYSQIRRYAPSLLKHFDFQATSGGKDVLSAITLLRDLNASGKRKLPDNAPISFVRKQWRAFVHQDDGLNRRYYELCALSELRNHLRSGDIWVPDSKQYRNFDGYLLGRSTFQELLQKKEIPVAVETDCAKYLSERIQLLTHRTNEIHGLVKNNKLDGVEIKNNRFSVKPHRKSPIPEDIKAIVSEVYAQLPKIKITDLLVEVDGWTHFTEQFTHLQTGLPIDNKKGLLTVILSDAINLGLTRMSEACSNISFKQLSWIADWSVRDECYSRALSEVVSEHHHRKLVQHWGDGTTSSSDGQNFPMGNIAKNLGSINPKYGSRAGVTFYTHISDQYSPFHTTLINTNMRDATYVLDGLLYHGSPLKIEEHYTDTAGFTDHVFGLCHLLGFRFAPRIRGIGDLSLFPIGATSQWPKLEGVFGEKIKTHEIEKQWDDVLRLASSIRLGTVTASLIIRKLASYPRQNKLALAMREIGRIERTLFILDWMQDKTLRARVQAGLNKGESRNALARAVFFNRLGEVRDRSFESQSYRASGLNLVVASIILWNTVYLEKAIEKVREKRDIPDDYLTFLSPLGWEHINLTGDYTWKMNP